MLTKSGWQETMSCVEMIATFLISGALELSMKVSCDKDWDKINAKYLFVLVLPGPAWYGERNESQVFLYNLCSGQTRDLSQSYGDISGVTWCHNLQPSAGALSHFIVLVAQVFDCEYFSPTPLVSDLMRLFVRSCATLIHRKIHSLGGDLIRSRLGNN